MSKLSNNPHLEHTPHYRIKRIRPITLFLSLIVLLLLTGMAINWRIFGRGSQAQAQVITTSTLVPFRDPSVNPRFRYKRATQPKSTSPSSDKPDPPNASNHPSTSRSLSELRIKPTQSFPVEPSQTPASIFIDGLSLEGGTIFLSIDEGGYKHIFAYHPQSLPFTRLTSGSWDDIAPSACSDGTRLSFASNRDGHWDIYVLDLPSGQTTRVTNTPEYDGVPSWSPDCQWLAYESYSTSVFDDPLDLIGNVVVDNLEIFIRQLDVNKPDEGELIRLTTDLGADYAPSWSPTGRQIAFVSTRSGESEIWLANLDRIENRFQNISQNPDAANIHPAWSPNGNSLAWASTAEGYQNIYLLDTETNQSIPHLIGSGNHPIWSPDGTTLITPLRTPNSTYLTGYIVDSQGLAIPPIGLTGSVFGLTWAPSNLPDPLPDSLTRIAKDDPTPDWQQALSTTEGVPEGRHSVVPITDVDAPYPMLHDMVNESFVALRESLITRIGWDYLSTLENAYVPLTTPLSPGKLQDWLYTGRAFALNPVPINAGWMLVMREDFGSETYWRVFLRSRYQDGSQGMPLDSLPWDFTARYSGDPLSYESGGALTKFIPSGYWLDFTQLAASYGWERLPALSTWRSALPSARYNEFVLINSVDWKTAMLEIYPPEALYTLDQ